MRVLLLGSGGREHALAWKIRSSPLVSALFIAAGKPSAPRATEEQRGAAARREQARVGLAAEGELVPLDILSAGEVAGWASERRIDLVVVGPEAPLVAGVTDELRRRGIAVFGPSSGAAQVEGSKVFAKRFMARHGIPSATFEIFSGAAEAREALRSGRVPVPCVVKADGLAAGKGVIVCQGIDTALAAVDQAMVSRAFGPAGERIVIEELLVGREASFFVLCDGRTAVPLQTCQDYKRLEDGDRGPNTGGMGGFSPSPFLDADTERTVMSLIVQPTLEGLASEGLPYHGVLYVGIMLTRDGPRVLEYNARFGDPETQAMMPRLESDIVPLLAGAARGELADAQPAWRAESSVCVVLASGGYPGVYPTGRVIEGLDQASSIEGVHIFHAGTRVDPDGRVLTAGGRVLAVVALGAGIEAARHRAYKAVAHIRFEGRHCRSDIAEDVPS